MTTLWWSKMLRTPGGNSRSSLAAEPGMTRVASRWNLSRSQCATGRRDGAGQYRQARDFASVAELARNEGGFDGFANANVIGDEQADGVLAERHQERDKLVRPRSNTDAAEAAERTGGGADAEASGVTEQAGGAIVARALRVGGWEFGRGDRLDGGEDTGGLVLSTANGPEEDEFVRGVGEDDRFTTSG